MDGRERDDDIIKAQTAQYSRYDLETIEFVAIVCPREPLKHLGQSVSCASDTLSEQNLHGDTHHQRTRCVVEPQVEQTHLVHERVPNSDPLRTQVKEKERIVHAKLGIYVQKKMSTKPIIKPSQ